MSRQFVKVIQDQKTTSKTQRADKRLVNVYITFTIASRNRFKMSVYRTFSFSWNVS